MILLGRGLYDFSHTNFLAYRIFPQTSKSHSKLAHEFSQNEFWHIRSKNTTASDVFYAFLKFMFILN
jgi:hypothetical protein